MWLIHAVTEPPSTVFRMHHGEVLVTKVRVPDGDGKVREVKPVAAPETLALCGKTVIAKDVAAPVTGNGDPWAQNDPWKGWKGTDAQVPTSAASMQQLEDKLVTEVLAKLPAPNMEQDDIPDKIHTLEKQVQTLMSRQQNLETKVQDHAAQHTAQLSSMQNQIRGHMETQQQNLTALMENQMAQIRGLLAKRGRDDLE